MIAGREEQVLPHGGSPTALWEIHAERERGGLGGWCWTGPGVITLIDTSPHTHAHAPQGPIRGLDLGRGCWERREGGRLAQVLLVSVTGV